MKKLLLGAIIFCCIGVYMGAQNQSKNPKILIAYYSKTGNTRTVAEYIRQSVGGDIFEIKPEKAYPEDYKSTTEIAKKEQKENARPALASNLKDISQYDIIFLGYPIWWGTMPMFFFTFLESHNFAGKTIIPFCTYGGSGVGQSVTDIKKSCPGTAVKDALGLRTAKVSGSKDDVSAWLKRLGMIKI